MAGKNRARSWLKCCGIFACLLLLVLAVGVVVLAAFSGGSAGGTLASGRSVTTHSDAWYLETRFSDDTVTIDTDGYKIVVAPEGLDVDGQRVAVIDAAVKSVVVNVEQGVVTFLADGTSVATYRR